MLDGEVTLTTAAGKKVELKHNDYAYLPPGDSSSIASSSGAGLLIYERIYALKVGASPVTVVPPGCACRQCNCC